MKDCAIQNQHKTRHINKDHDTELQKNKKQTGKKQFHHKYKFFPRKFTLNEHKILVNNNKV